MYIPILPGRNSDLTQAAYDEITLGENPCALIKRIYFADTHWTKCNDAVGNKYTTLKRIVRLQLPDTPELEILKWISHMSSEDIREYLDGDLQTMDA